jgi:CDP-diacylglycerol pyrophosphatase
MVRLIKATISRSALAALLMLALTANAWAAGNRNALWHIVGHCLDSTAANYCTTCPAPLEESTCAQGASCLGTTQIWNRTQDYVAIRDRKACGCPDNFVHGLAMPLKPVSGQAEGGRPDGIWEFAWQTAENRIRDILGIALIVNPPAWQSQDQLHVHILRLRSNARDRLSAKAARIPNLVSVWSSAKELAKAASLDDRYGVLVLRDTEGGYLLVVDTAPLESAYGEGRCSQVAQ